MWFNFGASLDTVSDQQTADRWQNQGTVYNPGRSRKTAAHARFRTLLRLLPGRDGAGTEFDPPTSGVGQWYRDVYRRRSRGLYALDHIKSRVHRGLARDRDDRRDCPACIDDRARSVGRSVGTHSTKPETRHRRGSAPAIIALAGSFSPVARNAARLPEHSRRGGHKPAIKVSHRVLTKVHIVERQHRSRRHVAAQGDPMRQSNRHSRACL